MNEKQILKEIAYYSKLIDNHKKTITRSQNPINKYSYKTRNTYQIPKNDYDTTKYKYVKPETSVILPAQERIPSKVLINPNFKQSVHINPRFTPKPQITPINNSIVHVNPKIINVNFIKNQKPIQTNLPFVMPLKTPEKIIKPIMPVNNVKIIKTASRKRRVSIRTKYKIVKSNTPNKVQSVNKTIIKNRFKIDRRSKCIKSKQKKKIITQSINDKLRTCLFNNKTWRRTSLRVEKNVTTNIKITKTRPENVKNRRSIITLRGNKYTAGLNKKSLRLIPNTRNVLSAKKVLVKVGRNKKLSVSQKSGSLTTSSASRLRRISLNKRECFRKNNIPCPVYHRFGKCRRKDAGRCVFKHNPQQIALCKKFLQGACLDDDCLLSHKVSLEKMPTCKYYLEGCCVRPNCSYLHVKISPNAEICRNFLEGFCKEAIKCDKRHQYLCPDFERYGKCKKLRCRYPHKTKCVKEKSTKIYTKKPDEKKEKVDNQESTDAPRYYVDKKKTDLSSCMVSNAPGVETNDDIYKRVKLGVLPSFIPIE